MAPRSSMGGRLMAVSHQPPIAQYSLTNVFFGRSFLGWWWWVGSGLGIGEVEDMILEEQQRRDSKLRKRNRKSSRSRSRRLPNRAGDESQNEEEEPVDVDDTVLSRWRRGVIGPSRLLSRRRNNNPPSSPPTTDSQSTPPHRPTSPHPTPTEAPTSTASGGTAALTTPQRIMHTIKRTYPITAALRFWHRLRHAHFTAAQVQALEQVELRVQMYGPTGAEMGGGGGWGLGNFGLRERDEAERRIREFTVEQRRGQLRRTSSGEGEDGDGGGEERSLEDRELQAGPSRTQDMGRTPDELPMPTSQPPRGRKTHQDPPWVQNQSRPFWWWGPLRRWRLQDSTTY